MANHIAVLGDIHGNFFALNAVLEDVKEKSTSQLLITGDLVGYYYHADQVLDALKDWQYELVQGNHDAMLGEISTWSNGKKETYRQKYGAALEYTASLFTKEQITYLAELPYRKKLIVDNCHILLCHGSPWNRDEYVYPDAPNDTLAHCAKGNFDVVIMGHSHYPMIKKYGATLILNPGSVGQPRNRQSPSWILLNLDSLDVELRHVTYNVKEVIAEAQQRDPEVPYLAEVLKRGIKE